MTIYYNSRYDVAGEVVVAPSRNAPEMTKSVFRVFPASFTGRLGTYTWKEGDRIDKVANFFTGDSNRWWEIMDLNPKIHSPCDIAPGMAITIPINKILPA